MGKDHFLSAGGHGSRLPRIERFFTEGSCYYSSMYAAFCDYCGGFSQSLNLCGLSLGAVLALNYAIDFPQRVNSLILIAPQYDMPKFLIERFPHDPSYYFSIKWLIPFYPALFAQAASGDGLRLGAAMPLTAGPRFHKTVFNRFMKN
ncbi:MAG: alpha/beta fold hydrolase [Candidatus Faecousia sp.]|nr:alpha/beta fold hydrolase [Candidatus Faecousia sp.]